MVAEDYFTLLSGNFAGQKNYKMIATSRNQTSRFTKQVKNRGNEIYVREKFKFFIYLRKALIGAVKGRISQLTQLFFYFYNCFDI